MNKKKKKKAKRAYGILPALGVGRALPAAKPPRAKRARHPHQVSPMVNPPPPGSAWVAIEKHRLELGLSARTLSSAAGLSPYFYGNLAKHGWNATEKSRAAVITALNAYAPPNSIKPTHGEGRLSTVRNALYERYPREAVNRAIAESAYIADVLVNELNTFVLFDEQLRARSRE